MKVSLLDYVKGYRKYAIIAPIFVIIETLCELLLPRYMAAIVDVGVTNGDVGYMVNQALIMVVLAVLAIICGTAAAKVAAIASQGFGANIRQGLYDKVQEFSFADIDRFSTGSLITRMTTDITAITMMLAMGIRMLVRAPTMIIASMVIAFSINGKLAVILLVAIGVMGMGVIVLILSASKLFVAMQERIDQLNTTVQENLVAIRVVKAFVRAGYEKTKFVRDNDALTDRATKVGLRMSTMQPMMMICLNATIVAVLLVGGQLVMGGDLLVGDLSSFLTYISQILMSVMMLAMSLFQFARARVCAGRIQEVLETVPDIRDPEVVGELPPSCGAVEFKDVFFKYVAGGTGDNVLSGVNLTIEPGQFLAIVGGTGVGKSSMVNLIPRFYDVTGGSVLVDGLDVREYPVEQLRARIGMVLQTNVLFSGTIRENLMWGKEDATDEELYQALKDAQGYDFVMSFPDGLDTWLEQGGVNLSGGQKQRMCIARAMLRSPAILILDDSTSAVDSATEAAIRESFHKNLKDTTIIIIAQRISSVQYADKIVVLDDDHIVGYGSHDELMADNEIYQEIYQSQQEGVEVE